jgi:hypothetical protein
MEKAKLMKNIGIGLICLIVVALLGFSIYQHRLLNNLSGAEHAETASDQMPTGDTNPASTVATPQKASRSAASGSRLASADIEEIEAELDATENELEAAYQQLDDDLARKQALQEKEEELRRQYMNSPAFRKNIRSNIAGQFEALLEDLNLSDEEKEAFLDQFADYQMARVDLNMEVQNATTDAEKDYLRQLNAEIRETNTEAMKELLGTDYEIYDDYMEMQTTRSVLSGFYDTLDEESRLTEAEEKELTQIMYEEQMEVFDEMGYDPRYDIEFPGDVKDGDIDGQAANMVKIHSKTLEKTRGVLSETQHNQLKNYLTRMQEMVEMQSQLSD